MTEVLSNIKRRAGPRQQQAPPFSQGLCSYRDLTRHSLDAWALSPTSHNWFCSHWSSATQALPTRSDGESASPTGRKAARPAGFRVNSPGPGACVLMLVPSFLALTSPDSAKDSELRHCLAPKRAPPVQTSSICRACDLSFKLDLSLGYL